MAKYAVALSRAATLIEGRFPLRCSDPATGDPVVVYPEREDDEHEEYDEETTFTSNHPDNGWYTYDIKRYHIPDPDGQEIGVIELIGESSSYSVTLLIRRTKPFNRAYNAYWTCVSAFFEEVQQILQQEEAARRQAALPKDTSRLQAPTLPAALPPVAADQRREFQVTFYGTPAEFGAIAGFFAQRQAPRYGGELFQVRLPLTPDAALVQIWVYDLVVARGCVGCIVAQRLPSGQARLFVLTDEAHFAALISVWELLRAELEQQGWIDPIQREPEAEPVADLPAPHHNQASDSAELRRPKNPNSGKYARTYEGRRQAVAKYRDAHRSGQIGVNKDTWASIHLGISGRTLLNWEHEFPDES
jgi:hypothetical protein